MLPGKRFCRIRFCQLGTLHHPEFQLLLNPECCENIEHEPLPVSVYFLRFGRCVSADPAADFAALLDFGLRSVLPAADAALVLVTSELLRCVNADPAADLAALLALGLRNVRAAADAAFLPVDSRFPLFAISLILSFAVWASKLPVDLRFSMG